MQATYERVLVQRLTPEEKAKLAEFKREVDRDVRWVYGKNSGVSNQEPEWVEQKARYTLTCGLD